MIVWPRTHSSGVARSAIKLFPELGLKTLFRNSELRNVPNTSLSLSGADECVRPYTFTADDRTVVIQLCVVLMLTVFMLTARRISLLCIPDFLYTAGAPC